jgi:hypothetical protein
MFNEISIEDCLTIHARTFLPGFSGLSAMLEDLLRAHDELQARSASGPQRAGQEPLLRTAHDVMSLVFHACQRIAGPCNAALEPGADDPMLSIAVNDSMAVMSDLLERLSVRLELPIGQWVTEIAAGIVRRDDWPALWRVSVWLGAMLHYTEDAAIAVQALMQFLGMGSIFETRRAGGEWLNEHGALAALDYYRRTPPPARKALQADVSLVCAHALRALAAASKARAERAVAAADATVASRFLNAKDLIHLGIHSQIARPGGIFLSHRGKDAKRPLMDFHRAARPELFLDIWARPAGDTNRRFLWRNLAAAGEMHAFVTANYAASDFCMKEVEAWGLLSLARGYATEETPGRFFVIAGASAGPADAMLCAWARHRREDTTLERAMTESAEALGRCGVLGARSTHSEQEKEASDAFNRALLGANLLRDSALPVIELSREPIQALIGLFRQGLALLRSVSEVSPESLDAIEAALPQGLPSSGAAFVAALRQIGSCLLAALKAHLKLEPVIRCALLAMAAMAEVSAHVVRHWDNGTPEAVGHSLYYFTKFGAVIDSAAEQFRAWCVALASARFDAQGDGELFAGLVLGLLPIDHEATDRGLRVDADFSVAPAPTLPQAFEAAGLARRTVQVVCTRTPTLWQRVAVIAALSSFTSRSFLFIDVEGSGALTASVGALEMQEFPHVTLARLEDLPAL